jgi:phenylalanyl-tRNA synthetase beta chain
MKAPVSWIRDFADVPADAATVGERLAACGFEVAGIEGEVVDFEITANRPDCLSVYGLAREAAAAFGVPLAAYDPWAPASGGPRGRRATVPSSGVRLPVSIGDPGCGRYALGVADVRVAASPAWLAERLVAAGLRPINNIVDVTNYVMVEMGHPMHAFDAAKLAGPEIRVRRAREGERITTLDRQVRTLDETMLVIADRDCAVAVAGVMGGLASEVARETTRIALESAWFQPASVRATARRMGLKTEASARFERGADLEAPVVAIHRALALFEQIGAGQAAGPIVDVHPLAPAPRDVPLRRSRLARLLGAVVPDQEVERILNALGFTLAPMPEGWQVDLPSHRVDVAREADLIEEVGRHWGYDRIPATFPPLRSVPRPSAPGVERSRRLRRLLCGAGLHEATTFTFIEAAASGPFADERARVAIQNPLSDKFAVLRPSLLPGLIDALVYSRRRESSDVRLFELGAAFTAAGETSRAGWVLTGSRGEHWSGGGGPLTFADARGIAELLAASVGTIVEASAADDLPWFVPGRRARLAIGGAPAGWVGQVRPEILAARGLDESGGVWGGEIDLDALFAPGPTRVRRVAPLPRHPSVVRDLSFFVDERLPAAEVRGTIQSHAPATLASIREFDRYQGKGVPAGQVSLSIRLTFRDPDRTLTDEEVQHSVERIVAAVIGAHGAVLRGTTG